MIGHGKSDHERHQAVSRNFRDESSSILKRLESHHHSHRQKIMQVQYPDTIKKLCRGGGVGGGQQRAAGAGNSAIASAQSRKVLREGEFMQQNTQNLKSEYGMNNRKLRYNRGNASEAVVSNIMQGGGPDVVDPVFPQGATHYQCLALTNKLSMPDANVMPPEVARPRRWLGDDRGW
eukprot:CAMPEP_0114416480 /NCGR_PEP_ID=MMETSP0103-20121206/2454_1 /TAXON_ID=37642 ORGANISM="Paraphysomonas imperforata, Strain PA2" /NCGR_SAMPLE_ID=MMETSP0103 /ASSEMBLY_ACC=CAM_ASM_000201 /LENGTH=176 /DNA_ID=CAMNT_0001584711 /DNA_START=107 /DNA_END=634 /DNA_ORIENTATION=-